MEHYRKLVNQLTGELGMHDQADGFPSAELRGRILLRLADLRLPAGDGKQKNHPQMDPEASRRLDYLIQARRIGVEVAQSFAREEFAMLSSHYLFGGILVGAELIGWEIAREYAVVLYPAIKCLYDEHIDLPFSEPANGKTEFQKVFAFTVKTHPYFIDVGKIEEIMSLVLSLMANRKRVTVKRSCFLRARKQKKNKSSGSVIGMVNRNPLRQDTAFRLKPRRREPLRSEKSATLLRMKNRRFYTMTTVEFPNFIPLTVLKTRSNIVKSLKGESSMIQPIRI